MADVPVRELRNRTRQVIERVHAGESVTITVDGRPAAQLQPLPTRPRFMDRRAFSAVITGHQADAALTAELAGLVPDTTDDLAW
ncbi:MAG: type II toxin-antitoxin system prevent-host-death family antitoxin [Acidimicrobiales bacterium]|nr:type II toxin-antitoxin system prevent-host-death family antitoxin [Acidimicrobiales bacterium]